MIMVLDLWNQLSIISEVGNNLIQLVQEEHCPFSALVFLLIFCAVVYLTWISTNIPNLPPPPRPPYVIQIQANFTTDNTGGSERLLRHNISDIRLLSSGALVDSVLHRPTRRPYYQNQNTHTRRSTLLFGLLRRPSPRPQLNFHPNSARLGFQASNFVLYHQVNVYHTNSTRSTDPVSSSPFDGDSGESLENTTQSHSTPADDNISPNTQDFQTGDILHEHRNALSTPAPETTGEEVDTLRDRTRINVEIDIDRVDVTRNSDVGVGVNLNGDVTIVEQNSSTLSSVHLESLLNADAYSVSSNKHCNKISGSRHESTQADQSDMSNRRSRTGDIRIILKFLNDTQLEVATQLNVKIADFKRLHFATEISENKSVRLIFNGRLLDNDSKTLSETGIFDQCVVHCLIVPVPNSGQRSHGTTQSRVNDGGHGNSERSATNRDAVEPGMFFVSILGILLIFLWFTCFHFGQQLFTQSAVVSLVVLTAVFVIGLVALYLPVQSTGEA